MTVDIAGHIVSPAILQTVAVSVGSALLAMIVLRIEVDLPLSICIMVIPSVTGLGLGLAIWLQLVVGLTLYETWGALGGALLALVVGYQGVKRARSEPPPPTIRYD